jgi:DNA recombination protein RmuC
MMAVQLMQALVRDERVREQTHIIQAEVRRLVEDVARLRGRALKLQSHFSGAEEDVAGLVASADRIAKCGERIDQMDFTAPGAESGADRLKAAE